MKNPRHYFKKLIYGALLLCICIAVPFACSKETPCETKTYYLDDDTDGYGNNAESKEACTKPEGNYVLQGGDTDDGDDNVNPGCTNKFYEDADNDGEGDPNTEVLACDPPVVEGKKYVANKLDPNDQDAEITSTSNCEVKKKFYKDLDGDEYGDPATEVEACTNPDEDVYVEDGTDTDDEEENIHPGCTYTYYWDGDGDGYGIPDEDKTILACGPVENYSNNPDDCHDGDPDINPGEMITYYEDLDGDEYGNPEVTLIVNSCDEAPEGYVTNPDDCNDGDIDINPDTLDVELYPDNDGDGHGNPNGETIMGNICVEQEGYVPNYDDCDDNDEDVYPGAPTPQNGLAYVQYDCNERSPNANVWLGPDMEFDKPFNAQHTTESGQDRITDEVWFTRHHDEDPAVLNHFVYNYKYWQDTYGMDAEIIDGNCDDLLSAIHQEGGGIYCNQEVLDHQGSPGITRWAILEKGGNTQAWEDFDLYAKLGTNKRFFSFSNVMSMLHHLAQNTGTVEAEQGFDHRIEVDGVKKYYPPALDKSEVEGVLLGVYLPYEDIYFTLTFTAISDVSPRTLSYTRSTPNN